MTKFKFNHLNHTLAYQNPWEETWTALTETFAGNFGSLGFQVKDGWMTFTVYPKKIRVFYKQIFDSGSDDFWEPVSVFYFSKDLPKEVPVVFEFSDQDRVEKVGNTWVKKGESKM